MSSTTLTVRGLKLRSQSRCRYIVVLVSHENGQYTGVMTYKRSDSLATAKAHARRYGFPRDSFCVVVDSATGEEV